MDDPDIWRWVWLGATGVFAVGEMAVAGSFFLAPFAVGAAVATAAAFAGAPLLIQWLLFVVVSAVTFAGFRPLARRLDATSPNHPVGATRLATRTAVVIEELPVRGVGLVRVDREQWRAETDWDAPVPAGSKVTVLEVRGTRLIVAPLGDVGSFDFLGLPPLELPLPEAPPAPGPPVDPPPHP